MYSLKNTLKTFTNAHKVRLTLLSGALLRIVMKYADLHDYVIHCHIV